MFNIFPSNALIEFNFFTLSAVSLDSEME